MFRVRSFIAFLCVALLLCAAGLRGARSQSSALRRITNTSEDGVNLNPSLSGDGRRLAFESNEDLAHAGGSDSFRALRATLSNATASFTQMGQTRAVAPALSQDGSRIAFASKDNPLGTNLDGNSEIFLFDGISLRQITNTSPGDISLRLTNGNFQPSLSDDARFIAFSSNRDLAGLNSDANLEIFIFDAVTQGFTQLTNTAGTIGSTDAKISGDGSAIAYIRDSNTMIGSPRDLVLQARTGGAPRVIATGLQNLSLTYGRAISDNGTRVVFSAPVGVGSDSPQVILYDRQSNTTRQITALADAFDNGDVPLHPTISGDGTRLAFATRRNLGSGNSDKSVELYTYHVPTAQFSRITTAPSSAKADVVSSLNDDGSLVAYSFPRVLSGAVSSSSLANNSEIYLSATTIGPPFGNELTVLNGAAFGNEPSSTEAVAPDSIAVALGGALAGVTLQAQRLPDGTFPLSLGGTTITVNNHPAQIFSVSPTQVTFLVPPATAIGTAEVVVTSGNGFQTRGPVEVLLSAPGIFTRSNDGRGEGYIVDAVTRQPGPFDPAGGTLRLIIFSTGARNATQLSVTIGGRIVAVEAVIPSTLMPGQDEIRVLVPADLRGAGTVDVVVRADDRASNSAQVSMSGQPRLDLRINEVLADPPDDLAGDANHDGTRDSSDDEFVELVNPTMRDIDISGYQLLTRSATASEDTVRHTFTAGTIFPAGTAIVIFGGGTPRPNVPVFGGAQVLTASNDGSSSSLSLTNSGASVTLREPSGAIISIFTYGNSTGLNGGSDQSLTRSPDMTGVFVLHTSAQGSNGRAYSPGTRASGAPFNATPAIARIQISPVSANIGTGARQQFTAHAFNSGGQELRGVIFRWQTSNPAVATIDQTGRATALKAGSTQIKVSARGVQSTNAVLTVSFQAQVLTRIEVTPSSASVPPGGQQQFTARALDQNGNEITGVRLAWSSTDENVSTVDGGGLATALNLGTTSIKATAQNITGMATLRVVAPLLIINEMLADPPGRVSTNLQGDANHDGVRNSSQDEFIELVNASHAPLDLSGWSILTRPLTGTTERTRHTFAAGTMLSPRTAMVIFGGGSFDPANPAFACAQVVKASSGRLSLTNSGLNIIVRDRSGNLFAQLLYGSAAGLNGGSDQSLTRSPDVTGNFVRHTEVAGAGGRRFSPGTRADGSPFNSCPGRLASVNIAPASASIIVNRTTQFTAQAFDQFSQHLTGITFTFASSNTNVATVESVNTNPSTGVATAIIKALSTGTAHVTAKASDGTTMVMSSPAQLTVTPAPPRVTRIELTPETATINRGQTRQFAVRAFNQNNPVSGVTFTLTSSNTAVATVDANGLAKGVGIGTTTITARAPDGNGGTVTDQALLNVQVPLIINELLADVPSDDEATPVVEGDANRDGVRDSGDDEFIELFNNSSSPVDLSGIIISDSTSNRFTFAANTSLAAGRAVVIFGGGTPTFNDPAFGGALILKASSLGLNDTGDTVTIKLPVAGTDMTIAAITYGTGSSLTAAKDQSLTRAPDASLGSTGGPFIAHNTATNASERRFSPGTRADGTPFASLSITRIQVTPSSATINIGATKSFTARAFSNTGGPEVEVQNVSFIWDSSDTSKATIAPQTGKMITATAIVGGSVMIRARAGSQQGTAALTINFPPISRIEVTPSSAKAPIGGNLQFTARAFDSGNHEITGVTFTWMSVNKRVATVDQNGLASALNTGTTTIKASARGVSDTATLNVFARTVAINEVLADPPDDAAGDANHDGMRDSSDDEFIELVNALNTPVNISGWKILTRSLTGTTESVRHTFAAGTNLPAGDAIVVFGGGAFNPDNPSFGGAQIVKASSGHLSLTNTGLHLIMRDASGNLITQLTYGSSTGLNGGSNQSLTRSPDITGGFTLHTAAAGANGRRYSPGTRADGSFFIPRMGHLASVNISPDSASVIVNRTTQFTAQAFDQFSQPLTGITFTFASSNTGVAVVDSVTTNAATGVATATVRGRRVGTAQITAKASDGTTMVMSSPAQLTVTPAPPRITRVELTPETATINRGQTRQFTAKAFNQNNPVSGVTFTLTSGNTAVATVDGNGLASGLGTGTVTITVSTPDGEGGTVTDQATLTVQMPLVINEILADPPEGANGDANRDGTRDGTQDEFVEMVNNSSSLVDLSGVIIADSTSNRFSFPANTTLAAGRAVIVFGGGTPTLSDPAFGGALIFTTGSSGLGLNNTGDTVNVSLPVAGTDVLIATLTYDSAGGENQSLTRSPDLSGALVQHSTLTASDGRIFSPGTRVDGTPFSSPPITRIEIAPSSATINIGETQSYTARAFSNTGGPEVEVQNIPFIWDSSDTSKATVAPTTGASTIATGVAGGNTTIRARAGGQQGIAALTINSPPVSRIEVTPPVATITIGGTQQFTARAFDTGNNEITGVAFTWLSTNSTVATIDQNGLASSVDLGTTTIKASAQGVDGTATLNVVAPSVIINEVLADPPDGLAGDANQDGLRSSGDDEFLEMVNSTSAGIDISGWRILTRSLTGTTESVRHIFAAGTNLPAGDAIVIFGGGAFDPDNPAFGGAQVAGASSGGLSLTNTGLHIIVLNATGEFVAQFTYGGSTGLEGNDNQSLTRSPDADIGSTGGGFVTHNTATNAAGRDFSPGTRADGTPFDSPPITRIEVSPTSATINVGAMQPFEARAYSNTGGPEIEVQNVSFIWDSSDTGKATVAPTTGMPTIATGVGAGDVMINARAGGAQSSATLTVEAVVESIELTPESTAVTVGNTVTFTATARDGGGGSIPGITFMFSLRDPVPAGAASITATTANTVTVRGDMEGAVTVVASYTRASDNMLFEDTSSLTINTMSGVPVPVAGQVIVNEALVAFATSTTQVRNDFLELYNTTSQPLDISGLVISYRPGGAGNQPSTVTLPGAVGSNTTLIQPNSYFLIVNGAETFGVTADFDASAFDFNLNNTTGGIQIEVSGVKLDGLSYQGGAAPPAAPFNTYGEGAILIFSSGTTNDLIRSPNATDTNDNLNDFRRNGTAANVTPKAANPTLLVNDLDWETTARVFFLPLADYLTGRRP